MLTLLIALIVFVLVLWAVSALLPLANLPAPVNTVIWVVIVVLAVLWLVSQLRGMNLA